MKTATGLVIRSFRRHLSYTQQFVADKLNITVTTLANIENGRVGLDLEKLYSLSKLFGIPVGVLLALIIEVLNNGSDCGLENAVQHLKPLQFDDLLDD